MDHGKPLRPHARSRERPSPFRREKPRSNHPKWPATAIPVLNTDTNVTKKQTQTSALYLALTSLRVFRPPDSLSHSLWDSVWDSVSGFGPQHPMADTSGVPLEEPLREHAVRTDGEMLASESGGMLRTLLACAPTTASRRTSSRDTVRNKHKRGNDALVP